MFITKVLETTVDIFNPIEIYASDIESILTKKLSERYVNRCYQSIYITDVSRIIRRSSIMMVDNRLDGAAYVDVQFEVKGIVLVQGEIIHGCKVIEIHANAITAENKFAGIKLQKEVGGNISKILKVGQKIPVVVQKSRYTPNQSSISVIGTPYIPAKTDEVFYTISKGLDPHETEKLGILMEKVEAEEALHKAISKEKPYEFFKDILYPFKVAQKYDQKKNISDLDFKYVPIELKSILNISDGLIVYPSEENKSNKRFLWSKHRDAEKLQTGSLIISSSLYPVISDIVDKYILYLQALRGFVETYPTPDSMQELLVYWKLCKAAQV